MKLSKYRFGLSKMVYVEPCSVALDFLIFDVYNYCNYLHLFNQASQIRKKIIIICYVME